MTLIIQVDDPGDIIGVKEIVASRLEDLGGVRVVEVRPDKETEEWRQEVLWTN